MLELLGMLFGGVFRLLPSMIAIFEKRQENAHELALIEKNLALEKQRGENRQLEIEGLTNQAVETNWSLGLVESLKNQLQLTGDRWLDRLNVSVRPILTYWWCVVMYTAAKLVIIIAAFSDHVALKEFYPILMTDFDRGVVGSIIGFWFVDRALRKP
jgi:hypothetical protein